MLSISIIILIMCKALINDKLSEDFYHRISSIILLFSGILSYNSIFDLSTILDLSTISEIGIYSGLFNITSISSILETFLLIVGSLILISWPKQEELIIEVVNSSKESSLSGYSAEVSSLSLEKSYLYSLVNSFLLENNYNNKSINSSNNNNIYSILNNNKFVSYSINYSIIVLFSSLGASLLISCSDLISMYLSIELQSFSLYVLSTLYRDSESATSAGLKYFLIGALASCLILFGAGLLYAYTGLTNFESIYMILSMYARHLFNFMTDSNGLIYFFVLFVYPLFSTEIMGPMFLGIIFIFVGFLIKISAAPFHNWSPAKRSGKTQRWDKLPNSGDTLKLLVPNYLWKEISGWINYSCMVISQKIDEKKMGYRGSKSDFINKSVKEQRVDGSWCKKYASMHLRYTLMGFERNYQIKIPSKQLNKLSFSTLHSTDGEIGKQNLSIINYNQVLNPWWITGFTDAEGCFQIQLRQDMKQKLKWRIGPAFQIKLHIKDIAILEAFKNTLGVGTVTKDKLNMANFNVWSVKELQVIIDHFDKYPLITCKASDFLLFKQCFEIIKKREHLTEKGLLEIIGLKSSLNLGLSEKLKKSFPNIISVNRPHHNLRGIPNPFWIAGFTSGDGSFNLHTSERNSKVSNNIHRKVFLTFSICLHIRDEDVIKTLISYFKSLNVQVSEDYIVPFENSVLPSLLKAEIKSSNHIYKTEKTVTLYFRKFSDIVNIIIPFFDKHPIQGQKSLDFSDFKKVAEIVKTKGHLTPEGYNKILIINSTMNQRRPWN
jgi:hypothetical protein